MSRAPRRRGAAVAFSLVLHAAAVLLYLYTPEPGRPGDPNADQPVEVVLVPQAATPSQPEAAGSDAPTPVRPPDPTSQDTGATTAPAPATPAQQAEAQPPPLPEPATPSPIPPLASLVEPPPLPVPEPPPPEPPRPELPVPAPEAEVQPSPPQPQPVPAPSRPTVRLFTPDDAAPFLPPQPQVPPLPIPPPPPLPQPAPPRAQPRPAPPPVARRTPPGTAFSDPMVLDFGPSQRQAARPRPGRGIDLTLGPVRPAAPGASSSRGSQADIRAPNVSPEWASLFRAWVEAHKYYPEQAARNGEDGPVTVQFEVDRDGRVSNLRLVGRSGSQWLDMGLQAMLRGARVPPLPPGTRDDRVPVTLTMNYILIRR